MRQADDGSSARLLEYGLRAAAVAAGALAAGFYGVSYWTVLNAGLETQNALYASPLYATSFAGMTVGRWAALVAVAAGVLAARRTLLPIAARLLRKLWGAIVDFPGTLRRLGARKLALIVFTSTVPPAILGYLAFEAYVRLELLVNYKTARHNLVVKDRTLNKSSLDALRDDGEAEHPLGLFKPNLSFTTTIYHPADKDRVGYRVTVKTNNLGYLSERDYQIERRPGEYRIAVIGDSYTGTTTMAEPWVDRVEDLLNADEALRRAVGDRTFRVFNLGWPGAGFAHFREVSRDKAPPFDPDLFVVNYIEADFPRRRQTIHSDAGKPVVSGVIPMSLDGTPQGQFQLHVMCEEPPLSLRNPRCYQYYNIFVKEDFELTGERLAKAYKMITDEFLIGKSLLTFYPYGYYKLIGALTKFDEYRLPDIFRFSTPSHDEMIDQAIESLRAIKRDHRNVLVTVNPIFEDYSNGDDAFKRTDEMLAKAPDLAVVKMRERMPTKGLSISQIRRWYNLPHDGHMSTEGGRVYAEAMAKLIAERVRNTSGARKAFGPGRGDAGARRP